VLKPSPKVKIRAASQVARMWNVRVVTPTRQ